ncbi:MAG: 4-(cytidine 5'-diphospho)-2-C-methyl-D-erythritol kinase [Allosphingosinicella sp.]|uniref:4-(cytidine 5'-diphospho)-2-C-methyl-D-erythritol kinase n=1 Tax=Allosphingosinicella sp. TaxID=2823234 RepID=UPI0039502344
MEEPAYAKLNLALHVRAREPDGYHRIETLFAFCADGDLLSVEPSGRLALDVTGPFAGDLGAAEDNLVLRAARMLGGGRGAALRLDKRLPVASGIGGGSADAAAALRLLTRFWKLDVAEAELLRIAAALGADVPACLRSKTAAGEGRGDRLREIDAPNLSGRPALLVNPRVPLSTAAVFRAWDAVDRGPLGGWEDGRNDLEPPARALVPEIGAVLDALRGARFARMSGSGATCFGLYDDAAARDADDARIAAAFPQWWRLATRLR